MLPLRPLMLSFALAIAVAAPGLAQDSTRREVVSLAPGESSVTLKGSLKGYASVDYVLTATTGQILDFVLETDNPSANFNVIAPGSDAAVFIGSTGGTIFNTMVGADGDYTVQVYLMRNAARRDEVANYALTISVMDKPAPDFADALAGGPDFWEVAGLTTGSLNLRKAPSTDAEIVGRLGNGDLLRNKGCRMEAEQRWCEVEGATDAAVTGWVAGQFLREAAGPAPVASTDATTAAGFNAEGTVKCSAGSDAFDQDCGFGVMRSATGAVITVTGPGSAKRVLTFTTADQVFVADDGADLAWKRQGDGWWISAGGKEFYLIPDAAILGG